MALATQLLASGRGVTGSSFFVGGMSSSVDPIFVDDRAYRHSQNTLNRGGTVGTRGGYRELFTLPEGKLQGLTSFRPVAGESSLVFAVAGKLYRSQYPFDRYELIPNIQLYAHAPTVYFASAIRSAERNADGTVQATEPRRTLIAQDGGFTRAAFWDGVDAGHSDPTTYSDDKGNVLTAGVPLGGPMCWSGGRLWVASGNKLFAGDIENPLSFTENEYLAEGGFFIFDEDITALAEVSSFETPVLLVFTKNRTHRIISGIRTRSTWKDTKDFQSVFLPNTGCVSHRAVTVLNGLVWWMSHFGLTNFDAAQQAKISSRMSSKDLPMMVSKANLNADLSSVALASFENFLLCSVPYGHYRNRHTWVYDAAVLPDQGEAWASVWTGTRPVEWVTDVFGGAPRIFHISADKDTKNRLLEAFRPERVDNIDPILCFVETKTHIDFSQKATGLDRKRLVFAETTFTDVRGDVEVDVYWAGTRGRYHHLAHHVLAATAGSIKYGEKMTVDAGVSSYQGQQRTLRTPEISGTPDGACSSCGVESKHHDWIDTGFSLLIVWRGQASLRSYRLFADPFQESGSGEAAVSESHPRVVAGSVCPN